MAPKATVNVRIAQPEDFELIAAIYNESIACGGITMDQELRTFHDIQTVWKKLNHREVLLVAEAENRIIGWGIIKRYSDRFGYHVCCETSVYLTFSETGNGYGAMLQAELMKRVADLGYYHIVAKILAANQGSIRFHQRLGFEIVGTQKDIGYLNGEWHDVVILQYLLPKSAKDCD